MDYILLVKHAENWLGLALPYYLISEPHQSFDRGSYFTEYLLLTVAEVHSYSQSSRNDLADHFCGNRCHHPGNLRGEDHNMVESVAVHGDEIDLHDANESKGRFADKFKFSTEVHDHRLGESVLYELILLNCYIIFISSLSVEGTTCIEESNRQAFDVRHALRTMMQLPAFRLEEFFVL